MSTFAKHKTSADRSATDRSRHKKKIEKAIREGIYHIVSDESIIGQDGKKKIKIPVKGIKEYRFVYGDNPDNKNVGTAPGKQVKRGQVLSRQNKSQQQGNGNGKPGNEEGEEFYEVEITLEELASHLFDSLKLPELDKKRFKTIMSEKFKRSGYRKQGIRPRLSKKQTLINKIKRRKRKADTLEEDERFPFHQSDLKYKHIKSKPKENDNAVIFFIMDVSGSMTQSKKFMARSFFFLLYHFLRYKYKNVDLVFISHTVDAKEVKEDEFFTRGNSGGTLISSGIEKCIEIVDQRYHIDHWNIYAFHCSDGDNWKSDVEKSVSLAKKLRDISQMFCFVEIIPGEERSLAWVDGLMSSHLRHLENEKFKNIELKKPENIWREFKKLFGGTDVF